MQRTLILSHSNEIGGTTHYDTGHVSHWCENGANIVIAPDGKTTNEDITKCDTELAKAIRELEDDGPGETPVRDMTAGEEADHNEIRERRA